jgi:polyferredoxin
MKWDEVLCAAGVALCAAMLGVWVYWAWSPADMPGHVYDGSFLTLLIGIVAAYCGFMLAAERRRRVRKIRPRSGGLS